MHHLAYVSSAVSEFTKPQLHELLERSQASNRKVGITGLLLYRGGNFIQVIEGDESDVRELYNKVCQDARHKGIFKLLDEPIDEREFPDWAMAFKDLEIEDCSEVPGYSHFLDSSWGEGDRAVAGSRARKLLAGFRDRLR